MYKEFETRTSYNYLKEVIKNLNEPICILGGWAVFFHVNEKFEKAQDKGSSIMTRNASKLGSKF